MSILPVDQRRRLRLSLVVFVVVTAVGSAAPEAAGRLPQPAVVQQDSSDAQRLHELARRRMERIEAQFDKVKRERKLVQEELDKCRGQQ